MTNVLPLRRLVTGPAPDPDRVLYTDIWFRGHNNQRYANLLPRIGRLDRYHFTVSDRSPLRGLEFRALRKTAGARHRVVFGAARRRGYGSLLVADRAQISYFPGPIVADCDDPKFTPEEVELLRRPNVRAVVAVNETVVRRYEELGVRKPYHLIPQGVSVGSIDRAAVAEVAGRHRANGDVVVGYMAAWLASEGDRAADNPLNNIDHLLELWNEIRVRVPNARLWLVGGASDRVRRRCEGRDDILVLGRIPSNQVLSYVSNFDIGLYPRITPQGYQASKVVEYMGCGVPIVSYDYPVTADVREAGAGRLVETPREFVEAVESLVVDEPRRGELAAASRAAGAARDFDLLARRYDEILDRHL